METKMERKMMKNWVKGVLRELFPQLDGSKVAFQPQSGTWTLDFSMCFKIPDGLEKVEQGFDEDVNRQGITAVMFGRFEDVCGMMLSTFQASPVKNEIKHTFAAPFPPMFGVVKREGKWGWLSDEDKLKLSEGSEILRKALELDDKLIADGIYELIENADTDMEIEAFVLRKYTALRGFYTFTVNDATLHQVWRDYHAQVQTA